MANDEHVAILKKGVDAWNKWRDENVNIRPDLSGVDLSRANLGGANFGDHTQLAKAPDLRSRRRNG
jgi:uncharacterized protein YjbI with pentapeptide repeats